MVEKKTRNQLKKTAKKTPKKKAKVKKVTAATAVLPHLKEAVANLDVAMVNARSLKLGDTNQRAFQQINNAIVRVGAAIDELAT